MIHTIKIHSVVNVITNSSSEIYNYYSESVSAAKEMIDEFLKVLQIEKTSDDLFYIECMCDVDQYIDHFDNDDNEEDRTNDPDTQPTETELRLLIEDVITGKVKKPKWMKDVEDNEDYGDGYLVPTTLYIIPKDKKYKKLAEKIIALVNSPTQEASYG